MISGITAKYASAVPSVKRETPASSENVKGKSFKETLQPPERTAPSNAIEEAFGGKLHEDVARFQNQIVAGKDIPVKDLLYYQIRISQFGLRVELISKVAESAVSTVKKFQNTQ